MEPKRIHAVVFKGQRKWIAQCLEYDIAAQSDTYEGLPGKLETVLNAEISFSESRGETPFETLPKAPARYWAMWRGAKDSDSAPEWQRVPDSIFSVHPAIVESSLSAESGL